MSAHGDDIAPVDGRASGSGAEILIISVLYLTRGPAKGKYRLGPVFIPNVHGGDEPAVGPLSAREAAAPCNTGPTVRPITRGIG